MPVPIWIKKAGDLLFIASGGGTRSITGLEQTLIERVVANFESETQEQVKRQLTQEYLVDRTNDRISSIHFYRLPSEMLVQDPEFQDLLYKVKMKVDGRMQTNRVTFYEGRIFGVELRRPRKEYRDAEIEIVEVVKGDPKQTLTTAIDRAVHGKS